MTEAFKGGHHYHMCIDVRGCLHNSSDRMLAGMFTNDDGSKMTAREVREELLNEVAKGHRVIPMGKCDNFDFQEGCMGHPDTTLPEDISP